MSKPKFPRYFVVNFDVFVKVEINKDIVTGTNQHGNPFPPKVALVEGEEITKKEFDKAVEISEINKLAT